MKKIINKELLTFNYHGEIIDVVLTRKKIKHFYLRVRKNQVFCSAPLMADQNEVEKFILIHLENLLSNIKEKIELNSANYAFFQGTKYELKIKIITKKEQEHVHFDNKKFLIFLKKAEHQQKIFRIWLEEQAVKIIIPLIREWEKIIDTRTHKILFDNRQTILGSNNLNKNLLRFSTLAMQFNRKQLIYLIVHELIHDFHPNHSQAFWKQVAQFIPHFKDVRHSLKYYS